MAAKQDIWRPTDLLAAFRRVGFNPSLSKVAALWGNTPVTVRLDDLDRICQALQCTVADLLEAEPVADQQGGQKTHRVAAAGDERGPVRPVARIDGLRRRRPPN
ncbi:helix-turn-helix domain-containing protein [Amycolatopsis thermoflava]|uniref:helix-turn-helix domain-containing protein n=1 Tax=Amycolatopsis thermoflava TaxID=84480 RepID=UPI00040F1240|nr:helix-turn-helix transcriptional regulator [Amycolatopsis thermoflava]